MKKRVFVVAAGLLVALASGAIAGEKGAQKPPSPEKKAAIKKAEHPEASFWKQVGLTEEQLAKMKALQKETSEKAQAIKKDASLTPEQRKAKLRALAEEHHKKQDAILTPQQKEKMKALMKAKAAERAGKEGEGKKAKPEQPVHKPKP